MELLNPNHVRHLMAYVLSDEGKLTAFMAPLSTSFNKLNSFFKFDQHFSKTENIMASGPAKNRIRRSVRVSANADDIFDVITDIERYKDWSGGCIENVRVVSNQPGRPVAEYRAGMLGVSFDFALQWDYSRPDRPVSFRTVGPTGLLRGLVGSYSVERKGHDAAVLSFDLVSDISPCVPALLQRAIRRFAADKATKELKRHVEDPAFKPVRPPSLARRGDLLQAELIRVVSELDRAAAGWLRTLRHRHHWSST